MPEMDGLQATAAIRSIERKLGKKRSIPIVAMTAYAMKTDKEYILSAGMDDYISKPFKFEQLAAVIAKLALLKNTPVIENSILSTGRKSDLQAKIMHACEDVETARAVIDCFLKKGTLYLEDIEKALLYNDSEKVRASAHQLKGAVSYFDYKQAVEYAAEIEQMGKSNKFEEAGKVLVKLTETVLELQAELKQILFRL